MEPRWLLQRIGDCLLPGESAASSEGALGGLVAESRAGKILVVHQQLFRQARLVQISRLWDTRWFTRRCSLRDVSDSRYSSTDFGGVLNDARCARIPRRNHAGCPLYRVTRKASGAMARMSYGERTADGKS